MSMKKGLLSGFIKIIAGGLLSLSVSSALAQSSQTLTITSANVMVVDGSLTIAVTTTATDGNNGGSLSYTTTNGTGSAFVGTGGIILALQAGTVTLTVSSSGDTNYLPATVSQLITIVKGTPILSMTPLNTLVVDGGLTASVTTTATYGRGGAISFNVVPSLCAF